MALLLLTVLQAQSSFPLRPEAASTTAADYDKLYLLLTGITVFFTVTIFLTIFYFMLRYRRRDPNVIPPPTQQSVILEVIWIAVPTVICVVLFFLSTRLFFRDAEPPQGAMEVFVVGKQWMWQLQHQEGQREINALHVPVGTPVRLTLTSQDVIHDFSVPAFRIKTDVIPGRYTSEWFEATQTGTYHLFCDQYCGMLHSGMIGWIYVMAPDEYAQWLRSNTTGESMVQAGERLFTQFECSSCHLVDGSGSGPALQGVFGKTVALTGGSSAVADDNFLRQAMVNPGSLPVSGYSRIMPSFQGELNEQQILQLIAYIKSLPAGSVETGSAGSASKSGNSGRNGNP